MRVVTLNVWSGFNYTGLIKLGEYEDQKTRDKRFDLLIKELKKIAPDILILNEANMVPEYVDKLSAEINMDSIYSVGVSGLKIGRFGFPVNLKEADVILAKKELNLSCVGRVHLGGVGIVRNNFSFHFSNLTQALVGKIEYNGVPVYIVATHWLACPDYSDATKKRVKILQEKNRYSIKNYNCAINKLTKDKKDKELEAKRLLKYISKKIPGNSSIILAGDFNSAPEWECIKTVLDFGFLDSYKEKKDGYTWDPKLNSNLSEYYVKDIFLKRKKLYDFLHSLDELESRRIDYIFYKNIQNTKKAKLCFTKKFDNINISDHFGIVSEFEISTGQ